MKKEQKELLFMKNPKFVPWLNGNHDLHNSKTKENFFLPNRYFNHDLLEPKASVLPMSYTERLATLTPLHAYSLTDIKTKTLKN